MIYEVIHLKNEMKNSRGGARLWTGNLTPVGDACDALSSLVR